jgi:hypothetical protein
MVASRQCTRHGIESPEGLRSDRGVSLLPSGARCRGDHADQGRVILAIAAGRRQHKDRTASLGGSFREWKGHNDRVGPFKDHERPLDPRRLTIRRKGVLMRQEIRRPVRQGASRRAYSSASYSAVSRHFSWLGFGAILHSLVKRGRYALSDGVCLPPLYLLHTQPYPPLWPQGQDHDGFGVAAGNAGELEA